MHFPERLKQFIAHKYLKLFKKLFPYMDLKNDITADDEELACNVVYGLIMSNEKLEDITVMNILEFNSALTKKITEKSINEDSLYFEELIYNQFEKSEKLEQSVFENVANKNHKLVEAVISDYFVQNNDYFKRVINEELQKDRGYFVDIIHNQYIKDMEIRTEIFKLFSENRYILQGKTEKAIYYEKNMSLDVCGYYLPVHLYNSVKIFVGNKYVGEAEKGVVRKDILEEFPIFNTVNAGWRLIRTSLNIDKDAKVKIVLYKDDEEVYCEDLDIQIEEQILELDNNPYWINMNSVKLHSSSVHKRVERFNTICYLLRNYMPWSNYKYYSKFIVAKDDIAYGNKLIEEIFIEIFSEGNVINFNNAAIKYQNINKFWVIINELLINEEYYFETENDSPVIIDGGANIGLAIYYFKNLYPQSNIIAFEPSKEAYSILCENVESNNWDNVTLYPFALDCEDRESELLIPPEDCLGASLTKRSLEDNNQLEITKEAVTCKKLSQYILDSVDFLKLDIEGVEVCVLKELEEKLNYINYMFCEYHYGETLKDNDFSELINILEKYNFCYQVTKSPSYQRMTGVKTMQRVGKRCSFNIWARKVK